MAEAKPTTPSPNESDETRSAEASPNLVAVPEAGEATEPAPPEGQGIAPKWVGLLAALLVLALLGLFVQSRQLADRAEQIGQLQAQVQGLEAQVAAAETELASYDMTLTLARTLAADLYERMGQLLGLVEGDPMRPGATLPPQEPEAPAGLAP